MKRCISMRMRSFVTCSRGSCATSTSTTNSGRIAHLADARPIACTGRTSLQGPLPRRHHSPALLNNWNILSKQAEPPLEKETVVDQIRFVLNQNGFRTIVTMMWMR